MGGADIDSAVCGQAATLAEVGRHREALDLGDHAITLFQSSRRISRGSVTRRSPEQAEAPLEGKVTPPR